MTHTDTELNLLKSQAAAGIGEYLLKAINARLVEYRALSETLGTASEEAQARFDEIVEIIANNVPGHEWDGSSVRLRNVDGEWGAWTDLLGPEGPEGPQGEQGPVGPEGPQGAQGDAGQSFQVDANGTFAERGAHDDEDEGFRYLSTDGDGGAVSTAVIFIKQSITSADWGAAIPFQGPVGPEGPQGLTGPQGDAGPQGIQGIKGDTGDIGPEGPAGEQGLPGNDGEVGPAGPEGDSAYDLAVAGGFVGTEAEWLDSFQNRANHTGEQTIATVTGLQTALDGKQAAFLSTGDLAAASLPAAVKYITVAGAAWQRVTPDHPMLGPDVVVNGGFDTDTGWTKDAGWSIAAGVATHNGAASNLFQVQTIIEGQPYLTVFEITDVASSSCRIMFRGGTQVLGSFRFAIGVYEQVLVGGAGNTHIQFNAQTDFDGSVDNISLRKLPADAIQSADGAWWAATITPVASTYLKRNAANDEYVPLTVPAVRADLGTFESTAELQAATVSTGIATITVAGVRWQRITSAHPRLGPDIIANGNIASDTVWAKGGGWSIGSGVAARTNTGSASNFSQAVALSPNAPYLGKFDVVSITGGSVNIRAGGVTGLTPGANHTTTGTKEDVIITGADNSNALIQGSASFAGSVDNVSLRALPADAVKSADGAWWARLTTESAGDPYVIFASGQSNMARQEAYDWDPPTNLFVWNGSATVTGTAFESPSIALINTAWSFAAQFARNNPHRTVCVVNVSYGGQPINEWLASWSTINMFAAIDANVEAALAFLGIDYIDCFLWWQGESDDVVPVGYYADFVTVLGRFNDRAWYKAATPAVIFGLSPTETSGHPRRDVMNAVLEAVAARDPARRMFVPTYTLPSARWADANHLDGQGYEMAGELGYTVFANGGRYGAKTFSGKVLLQDDQAIKIPPPFLAGHVIFQVGMTGIASFDFSVTNGTVGRESAGAAATVGTGPLAGMTGTDVRMNYTAANDGYLYVENRIGGPRYVYWQWTGSAGQNP